MTITDERALELLRENFAEPNCWDWCSDYGEPGYSHDGDQQVVVMGDYWCRCKKHPHAGQVRHRFHGEPEVIQPGELHALSMHHPRLWARFEEVASFEWHDEWIVDHENDQCFRTTGDCYAWQPSWAMSEGGDIVTIADDAQTWLDVLGLDGDNPIQLHSNQVRAGDLAALGFKFWPDEDDGEYFETGWHPGQDDNPEEKVKRIREMHGDDVHIICYITGVGQFDSRWKMLYRNPEEEE
jgi:hypothetical protein